MLQHCRPEEGQNTDSVAQIKKASADVLEVVQIVTQDLLETHNKNHCFFLFSSLAKT